MHLEHYETSFALENDAIQLTDGDFVIGFYANCKTIQT